MNKGCWPPTSSQAALGGGGQRAAVMASERHSESPGVIIPVLTRATAAIPSRTPTYPQGAVGPPAGIWAYRETKDAAKAGLWPSPPRPDRVRSQQRVTHTSEALVRDGDSSCSARDCGPSPARSHSTCRGAVHRWGRRTAATPSSGGRSAQHLAHKCHGAVPGTKRPAVPGPGYL